MELTAIGLIPAAIILATIAIGGFLKGVTGLGLPVFAIPALAMFLPVDNAVVVMALPSLIANAWLIIVHREHFPIIKEHRTFLALGFIGALLGTWFLARMDDSVLRIVLAGWLGVYLVQHYTKSSTSEAYAGKSGLKGVLGLAAGTLQGATGISEPVIAPYYHARGLSLSAYAFAVACTFALLSTAQLAAMGGAKLFTPTLFGYSLLATATTLLFVPIGIRIGKKMRQETFDRFLPIVFIFIEIKLVYDVIVSFL